MRGALLIAAALTVILMARFGSTLRSEDEPKRASRPEARLVCLLLDSEAVPLTDWIEVTEDERALYHSPQGGRVVYVKLIGRDDKGAISFQVSGLKLAFKAREFKVAATDAGPITILITEYPGSDNLSLMYKLK